MSFQILEQDMANAIGFVMDRTANPPRFLAQGFLVSKSRFVTTAGKIFHYTECPWALTIYFPHPDITLSVKSIGLHNEFEKPVMRQAYLSQTGYPGELLPTLPNDMALLVVDSVMPELMPEKVAELHRAMSLPFSNKGIESSGNVRGQEYLQVLNGLLEQGRSGLFTLIDAYNVPIARILLNNNTIPLVYYRQPELPPAYAFFELAYRQPAHGFAFQPEGEFPWPENPPIGAPADRLIWEAMRRANEVPGIMNSLGGKDGRYQRVVQQYDPSTASEEIRWMAGRLWDALDGYLTLDRLAERCIADTYTCLVAVRELVNRGVISQINKRTPLHCNGTLGNPLTSHTDFEVHNWDNLQAFYLDPLSAKPVWLQGNYFGSASAVQPKNMLHTINVPVDAAGALILKDYKLIGLHSGPQTVKAGQPAPPVKCWQFMWMGALLDMSTKKLRTATEAGEGEEVGLGLLRTKLDAEVTAPSAAGAERIICPVCFSSNSAYGACASCGANIEAPPAEPDTTTVKGKAEKTLKVVQKKTGLTKKQLIIAAAVLGPLFLMTVAMLPKPAAVPPPGAGTGNPELDKLVYVPKAHESSDKATVLATKSAGFKVTPIPDWWYEDTSELTKPAPSFGAYSERTNQKLLFVLFEDMSPVANLTAFAGKPPYISDGEVLTATDENVLDHGEQVLGDSTIKWIIDRCRDKEGKEVRVFLAAFPAMEPGKSFLIVGQKYDPKATAGFDHQIALATVDQLAADRTAKANRSKLGQSEGTPTTAGNASATGTGTDSAETDDEEDGVKKPATAEDIEAFFATVKEKVKANLELPDWAKEELKKPDKSTRKKWKVRITVGVDQQGNLKRLEKQDVTEEDIEKVSSALVNAVTASAPFKDVPAFKGPELKFVVKLSGEKIKVEKPQDATSL
ncbi:MAG: hypothetical protein JST01_02220 [Cyanobacteria bacterium SZAS TMP-1]|nr:hypothetical protein [Cyanobacteria bacterium SZAS TMP-1]